MSPIGYILRFSPVLLLALAGAASAQTAERPAVKPGDHWYFTQYWLLPTVEPSIVWAIQSVSAAGIEGTENGEPLRMTPDLGVLDSPRWSDSNPNSLRFPLAVGKQWRYSTDWVFKEKRSSGRADVDVTVAAYEKLRVPAGEFDTFRLESRSALKGLAGIGSFIEAESRLTYWYAPAVRVIVKSVSRNPYLGTSTVELVRYHLQP
jgi:hypothetical protein